MWIVDKIKEGYSRIVHGYTPTIPPESGDANQVSHYVAMAFYCDGERISETNAKKHERRMRPGIRVRPSKLQPLEDLLKGLGE